MLTGLGVEMRVLVWGTDAQQVERALGMAGQGDGRRGWRFTIVERLSDTACPIDELDPMAVAAQRGDGWAYAVYRERGDHG